MAGINPFDYEQLPPISFNPQDRTYRGPGGIILDADIARAQIAEYNENKHRNAAAWYRSKLESSRRSVWQRWDSRMLRMKEKEVARRLRPVYKALWFFGYLWGGMTLVAATAWLFKFAVFSTLG